MRRIALFGREVLRERCRSLDPENDTEYLELLLADMRNILLEHDGLGLAAPQAGDPVRVFIAADSSELPLGVNTVFINPRIQLSGPVVRGEEGCLSFPGIYTDVDRSRDVRISALDRNWKPFSLDLSGLASRLVQHEYDHLNGVLLVDRMGPIRRRLLRNRLKNIREESC